MSDQDYTAFLEKANQDTGGAQASSSSKIGTKSVDTAVPQVLEQVEEYYVSDADEPFEVVSLKFDKGGDAVSAEQLKSLIQHDSEVAEISEKDFDPRGQYKSVVEAVKKAGNGKVKFFRVEHGGTRSEVFVVSVDGGEGKVVGLKALVVES